MRYAADGSEGDSGLAKVTQNQFTIRLGAGQVF
jgi:hypothetical protein